MMETNRSVENTYKILYKIQSLETYVNEIETTARGFLLTKDSLYLRPLKDQARTVNNAVDTLQTLISDNEKQRIKLAMLHSTIRLRMSTLNYIINKVARKDTTGLSASLLKSKWLMDNLEIEIRDLENRELEILRENSSKKLIYEEITPGYFRFIVFFTILVLLVSFYFVNRGLRQRLRYQKQLEIKIVELRRSNEELEQIAHVASHDLQEPLRKIRTFTNRLMIKYAASFNTEVKNMLIRIDVSASRMHELVLDVVNFTNLIYSSENVSDVSLDLIIRQALEDLKPDITLKNAIIRYDTLPVIQGYPKQLTLLFKSLLDNSLKFTRKEVYPEIMIRFNKQNTGDRLMVHVSVEDNGIGFDNQFERKIFMPFQRLHAHDSGYQGQGIGLAIVQRVIFNHNGTVAAKGRPGNGAVFDLYFPVNLG